MKFVTWKTVFLVSMAMAARCSEVHALTFDDLAFEDNYKFAVVSPLPEFRAKTHKEHRQVTIPALGPSARGSREDKLLCPVRALKIYRAQTYSLRKSTPGVRHLFISYKRVFPEISAR